jgi:mRNA interferase MazF
MSRGDIYLADLNPSRGSEQAGVRPVIIVQRGTIDRFTQTVVIVPITSNLRRLNIPGTFTIPTGEGGLTQESVALCYQIAVIDRQRLIRHLGKISSVCVQQLNEALIYTLELDESISEID